MSSGRRELVGTCGYGGDVRIATWNVNSIKQRMPRFLPWLDERQPDVVCLQETKLADDAFHALLDGDLAERGYQAAIYGEPRWNGVALLSKVGLDDVRLGIPGAPGFPEPEARAVSATCAGLRIYSLYVPNGREPDSDHYQYKLAWLAALRELVAANPDDHGAVRGHEHRACRRGRVRPGRLRRPDARDPAGTGRAGRDRQTSGCTTWCGSGGPTSACSATGTTGPACSTRTWACASTWCWPVTRWRSGRRRRGSTERRARAPVPSDHAPVIVDLDTAPDGDIGPMVPPPSAGRPKRAVKLPQA